MKRLQNLLLGLVVGATAISCGEAQIEQPQKIVIYQVFTRLFGSDNPSPEFNGDLSVNGTGKFEDFTRVALDSIAAMGMTHIWYTGVIEHASIYSVDTVGGIQMNHPGVIKGKAGSPYAIKDYYDVNSYLVSNVEQRMEEFEALVERSHNSNLKVIIDFVPNHVARGYHSDSAPEGVEDLGAADDNSVAFSSNNNFYYIPNEPLRPQFDTRQGCEPYHEMPAKVTGNDVFSAEPVLNDWYETIKLNYGVDYQNERATHFDPVPDTWFKMRDILLFWASKGIDGFRCDMAEMVPCEFWEWAIAEVKAQYPELIFIAEIYNPEAYADYVERGGFDYLYDKVGLYDTLKGVVQGRLPSSAISDDRAKIAPMQSHMLNFLENHDEQRIAWHEFAGDAAAGIPMMLVSTLSDNIPMMIYFGQELGEVSAEATGYAASTGRTTIFDFWSVDLYQKWRNGGRFDGAELTAEQRKLRSDYIAILKMANQEQSFLDGEFIDLTLSHPESDSRVYAFVRSLSTRAALVVVNLSNESVTTSYNIGDTIFDIHSWRTIFGEGVTLTDDGEIEVVMPPYGAAVVIIE